MCKYGQTARDYFMQGYNCSQATVAAFAEDVGLDAGILLRLAMPFGGGIAGRGETCGAVTGMLMASGFLLGCCEAKAPEDKNAFNARMRGLIDAFQEQFGCVHCAGLLACKPEEANRRDYCGSLVYRAAELAAEEAGLSTR